MKKKRKCVTAHDIHELALNLPLSEYFNLFQLMFNNVVAFIKSSEDLVNKYNQEFKINKGNVKTNGSKSEKDI